MSKIHNKSRKKTTHIKVRVKGGETETDLEQKYSLESIDEEKKNNNSNLIIGFLGIGALLYNVFYVKQQINNTKEVLFI